MSIRDVTDALIDDVVSKIDDNASAYFSGISAGFAIPEVIEKGLPRLTNNIYPSVNVVAERMVRDGAIYIGTVRVMFLTTGIDPEDVATNVALGADALAQLVDDKMDGVQSISYEFGYDYDGPSGASLVFDIAL